MLPEGSFIGVKLNGKISAGKVAAGESAPSISVKVLNDKSTTLTLPSPEISGGVRVDYNGVSFPLNIPAKTEVNFTITPKATVTGVQNSEIDFQFSDSSHFKFNIELNAK